MCGEHFGKSDFTCVKYRKQWKMEWSVNYLPDTYWFDNLFLLDFIFEVAWVNALSQICSVKREKPGASFLVCKLNWPTWVVADRDPGYRWYRLDACHFNFSSRYDLLNPLVGLWTSFIFDSTNFEAREESYSLCIGKYAESVVTKSLGKR